MIAEMTIGQSPNPNWAQLPLFDRSRWKTVRFGDVVDVVSDTVRDAKNEGIGRYIGMEHLEPGSLHIRTWGELADGITFTKRCRVGQVLFGKRRAYQRKVAVAEFEAVVSGDIYVFQAKADRLYPKLLPFLCMSERFFQFAVETSAGSLSPRTNWSHLAEFEFALPPLDQQRRIAVLLWAVDEDSQSKAELSTSIQSTIDSLLGSLFPVNGKFAAGIDVTSLQELCAEPISYGIVQAGPHVDDGIPYIRVSDMTSGPLRLDGMLRTEPAIAARFKRSTARAGELVCALRGPAGLLSLVPDELDGANLTQGTARISLHDKGMTQYILDVFESPFMRLQLSKKAKGSTFTELTLGTLREIEVPVLKEARRERFGTQMNGLRSAKAEALGATRASRMFLEQLLNTLQA